MRSIVGIIAVLVIAAVVGAGAYQLGVAQGLAGAGTAVAPVYYHPYAFGGVGFLFPLLFILLIFFLLRGAFWGGWGRRYGGVGPGYWGPRSRLEEWHREMHAEKPSDTGSSSSSSPPTGR
jgi:hypothetical protein